MSTEYPKIIHAVYAGRRIDADKNFAYVYYQVNEEGGLGQDLIFSAKPKYSIVGSVVGVIQTGEKTFQIRSATYLKMYDNRDKITEWKALDVSSETEKDLYKEEKESDEWAETLRPIREAYFKARTRRQQSAIIARVIVAIQGGR